MKKLIAICLVCMIVSGLSGLANGNIVTVDPDAFPAGTVLNNAYPSVTLTTQGVGPSGPMNPTVLSLTSSLATTGTRVFGHLGDFATLWGDGYFDWLRADFAGGAIQVSLDFISNDGDKNAVLNAYNSSGVLVDQDVYSQTLSPGQFVTLTVSAPYISYITAEGDPIQRFDNWALDNLVYSPVPEPATICILGLGALSLIRRKK